MLVADGFVHVAEGVVVEAMVGIDGDGFLEIFDGVGVAGGGQRAVNELDVGAGEEADVGDGVIPAAEQVPGGVLPGVEADGFEGFVLKKAGIGEAVFDAGKLAVLGVTDGEGGVGDGVGGVGLDGVAGAGEGAGEEIFLGGHELGLMHQIAVAAAEEAEEGGMAGGVGLRAGIDVEGMAGIAGFYGGIGLGEGVGEVGGGGVKNEQ